MTTAKLSTGGFRQDKPAIYLILFRNPKGKVVKFYVGKTWTSNKTGKRSPFERLGKHLHKSGNTRSCIWDLLPSKIDKNRLKIELFSSFFREEQVKDFEDWMLWSIRDKKGLLNVKRPPQCPKTLIPKDLKKLYKLVKNLP